MKFLYGYKTKDNVEREGEIKASSRDDAFRQLKAQGIRPYKVVLAPGFLNRLQSYGKRTYAIVVLCALCLVLCAVVVRTKHEARSTADGPLPRHQIYGDPATMEELARTDYAVVFDDVGLRFLSRYAQPGVINPKAPAPSSEVLDALAKCVNTPVVFADGEPREHRELKQIVLTLQEELKAYLANGIGTPKRYVWRLNERQEREAQIYFTAVNDVKKSTDPALRDRINESLRAIGLRTISRSENGVTQTGKNF